MWVDKNLTRIIILTKMRGRDWKEMTKKEKQI